MPPTAADWENIWVKSWLQKHHRHLLSKVNVRGAHHTWVQRDVGGRSCLVTEMKTACLFYCFQR